MDVRKKRNEVKSAWIKSREKINHDVTTFLWNIDITNIKKCVFNEVEKLKEKSKTSVIFSMK